MTLNAFLSAYGGADKDGVYYGNDCISIEGYCEEMGQNEVMASEWYKEIKDREIETWQTVGGDGAHNTEICITLK